jgi:hypothetical protein
MSIGRKIKWALATVQMRVEMIKLSTDQQWLAEIALKFRGKSYGDPDYDSERESEYRDYRKAAVKNLTDQSVLAKVADDVFVQQEVIEKLTDQEALAKIAGTTIDCHIREKAFAKLKDHVLLTKIALEAKESENRKAATEKLTDATILSKIAKEDKESSVREAAVDKLTDVNLLSEIMATDDDCNVRYATIWRRSELTLSAEMFRKAIKDQTDQAFLSWIALKTKNSKDCLAIINKVMDQETLVKVATETEDKDVCRLAMSRITKQDWLYNIALRSPRPFCRREAVSHLTDREALGRLAAGSILMDPFVKGCAEMKLREMPDDPSCVICNRCGKRIKVSGQDSKILVGGVDVMSYLEENSVYECSFCHMRVCMDCMSVIRAGACPFCRQYVHYSLLKPKK